MHCRALQLTTATTAACGKQLYQYKTTETEELGLPFAPRSNSAVQPIDTILPALPDRDRASGTRMFLTLELNAQAEGGWAKVIVGIVWD